MSAADISPDGMTLAIGMLNSSQNIGFVAEVSLYQNTPHQYHILTNPGAPVSQVIYSPNASTILYMREHGDNTQSLWLANSRTYGTRSQSDLQRNDSRLTDGKLAISRKPFGPDDRLITYARITSLGRSEIQIASLTNTDTHVELGQGFSPCWHPRGDYLVVLAFDRSQERQLFAVETSAPYRRKQLSYVSGGLQNTCDITADGRWAVGLLEKPNANSAIMVELTKIQFN